MRIPGMLLIGSFHRNAGKTSLSTRIIEHWSQRVPVVAMKMTIIRNSDTSLGSAGFVLTEEKNSLSGKDTARMLRAGAHKVYWLRSREDTVMAGVKELLRQISPGTALVCEGNTIRRFVRPDVFIMVRNLSEGEDKSSARRVCAMTDIILETRNGKPELSSEAVQYRGGVWRLSHKLFRQAGVRIPAVDELPCQSNSRTVT